MEKLVCSWKMTQNSQVGSEQHTYIKDVWLYQFYFVGILYTFVVKRALRVKDTLLKNMTKRMQSKFFSQNPAFFAWHTKYGNEKWNALQLFAFTIQIECIIYKLLWCWLWLRQNLQGKDTNMSDYKMMFTSNLVYYNKLYSFYVSINNNYLPEPISV